MGEMRNAFKIVVRKPNTLHLGDIYVDGMIILNTFINFRLHEKQRLS
jgi:hypothetical protein